MRSRSGRLDCAGRAMGAVREMVRGQENGVTLVEVLPSLRTSLPPRLASEVWPCTARRVGADLHVGGVSLTSLAQRYGTPCHVLDERDVRQRCREYRDAFGQGAVTYAARALACRGVLRWIEEEGLGLSVCSVGELAVAGAVGFPAGRVVLHGDARTPADLRAALEYRVARVGIGSLSEIPRLGAGGHGRQKVLLPVLLGPGRAGATGIAMAPDEERFGLPVGHDGLDEAVRRVAGQPGLELVGLDYFL